MNRLCQTVDVSRAGYYRFRRLRQGPLGELVADEIGFSVLRYREQTPVLAACTRCQLKFLTPAGMMGDWQAAIDYLRKKYSDHRCAIAPSGKKDDNRDPQSILEADTTRKPRSRAV